MNDGLRLVAAMQQEGRLIEATAIGNEVKATNNIWDAIGVLTNRLGAEAGRHLETLLCKELHKTEVGAGDQLCDSDGKVIAQKDEDGKWRDV